MRLGALALGQLRAALRGVAVALRAQQPGLQVGNPVRGLRALRLRDAPGLWLGLNQSQNEDRMAAQ